MASAEISRSPGAPMPLFCVCKYTCNRACNFSSASIPSFYLPKTPFHVLIPSPPPSPTFRKIGSRSTWSATHLRQARSNMSSSCGARVAASVRQYYRQLSLRATATTTTAAAAAVKTVNSPSFPSSLLQPPRLLNFNAVLKEVPCAGWLRKSVLVRNRSFAPSKVRTDVFIPRKSRLCQVMTY